jgi:LacI family transcriptional regulator
MKTTLEDLAQAAGVGKSTVCRALKGEGRIHPDTKARILRLAAEMHYRPSPLAQSLSLGRSQMVGILATPSIIPVYSSIIDPIARTLHQAGFSLLLYTTSGSGTDEELSIQQLLDHRVAGVIIHPSSTQINTAGYQQLVNAGIHVVIIDRFVEGLAVPQIISDDYRAAHEATTYLLRLGHRRIAHLAIPTSSFAGQARMRGFLEALAEAGVSPDDCPVIEVPLQRNAGIEAMQCLITRNPRPTAVLARQDLVAIGAMQAIYEAGLSVPDDISLIGNGDFWCDAMLRVPLTTVHFPVDEMAHRAVHILLQQLCGAALEPDTHILPTTLVIRDSCAPPR